MLMQTLFVAGIAYVIGRGAPRQCPQCDGCAACGADAGAGPAAPAGPPVDAIEIGRVVDLPLLAALPPNVKASIAEALQAGWRVFYQMRPGRLVDVVVWRPDDGQTLGFSYQDANGDKTGKGDAVGAPLPPYVESYPY